MGRVGKPRGLGAQGFISEGMLLVSRDAHFTSSQKQLSAPTHHKLHPRSSWHAKWFPPPPFTLNFFLLSGSVYPPSPSFFHFLTDRPSFSCCCTPTLTVTPTLSLLSAVPLCPHVTPICVSCMFCDSGTIFFFQAILE